MLTLTRRLGTSSRLIALSFFLWGLGEGLWFYIQPLYPERLGAKPEQIGLVLAMLNLGHLLAVIPFTLALTRYNPRNVMLPGYVMGAASVLILAVAPGWEVAGLGFFVHGIALAGFIPVNVYLVQAVHSDPTRHESVGLHTILTYTWASNAAGIVVAPAMGGLLGDLLSIRAIFYVSTFWLALSTLAALFCPTFPVLKDLDPQRDRSSLVRNARFRGLFVVLALLFTTGPLGFALYPRFLEEIHGFSTESLGFLGTISAIGVTVMSLWLGGRTAWRGLFYALGMTLLAFLIFYVTSDPLIVGVGYFLFGGWRAIRPIATSLLSETARTDQQNYAFAAVELLESMGGIAAPLLAGILYAREAELPVTAAIVLTIITMIATLWVATHRNTSRVVSYNSVTNE